MAIRKKKRKLPKASPGAAPRGRKKATIKAHSRSPRGPDKGKKRVRVRRHRAFRGPRN